MALAGTEQYADMLWLDVEASGLQVGSYPIEVGWCGIDLSPISFLVRPLEIWDVEDWSSSSERIHGISRRRLLEFGLDARDIAEWLNTACRGRTVLADNPTHDSSWLGKLFRETKVLQEFAVLDATHFAGVAAGLSGLSQFEVQGLLDRIHRRYPHPHRAGPDARRSAAEFLVLAMPHCLQEIENLA